MKIGPVTPERRNCNIWDDRAKIVISHWISKKSSGPTFSKFSAFIDIYVGIIQLAFVLWSLKWHCCGNQLIWGLFTVVKIDWFHSLLWHSKMEWIIITLSMCELTAAVMPLHYVKIWWTLEFKSGEMKFCNNWAKNGQKSAYCTKYVSGWGGGKGTCISHSHASHAPVSVSCQFDSQLAKSPTASTEISSAVRWHKRMAICPSIG